MNRKQYEMLWILRKIQRKLLGRPLQMKSYAGKRVHNNREAGNILSNWINTGEPFMAARFGGTELNAIVKYQNTGKRASEEKREALNQLVHFSGFFPNEIEYLGEFCECMYQACAKLDVLGVWYNYMEDYMVERYCPNCVTVRLEGLEPWYTE